MNLKPMINFIQRKIARKVAFVGGLITIGISILIITVIMSITSGIYSEKLEEYFYALIASITEDFPKGTEKQGHNFDSLTEAITPFKMIKSVKLLNSMGEVFWPPKSTLPPRKKLKDKDKNLIGKQIYLDKNEAFAIAPVYTVKKCGKCHSTQPSGSFFFLQLDKKRVFASTKNFELYLLIIGLVFVVLSFFILVTITNHFLEKPLQRLTETIKHAEEGDFLIRAQEESSDEFGRLAKDFNKMLAKITDLNVNIIDTDRELADVVRLQKSLEEKNRIIEQTNTRLQDRVCELSLLYDINKTIASALNLNDMLKMIVFKASDTMKLDEFTILLTNETKDRLVISANYGFEDKVNIIETSFGMGEGISGAVATTGEIILINDTQKDPRYLHYKGKSQKDGSFLCVPIRFRHDIIGVFNLLRGRIDAFTKSEIDLISTIADQCAIAIGFGLLLKKIKDQGITEMPFNQP